MRAVRGFVLIGALGYAAVASQSQTQLIPRDPLSNCKLRIFDGFDSRLKPEVVGRLPGQSEPIVGFEIVRNRPLVALPHKLLGFKKNGISEFEVSDVTKGIAVNGRSDLLIQTTTGIKRLGNDALQTDTTLTSVVQGRLYDSGSSVYMEVRARKDLVQFVARKDGGNSFTVATIRGTFHAATWNENGLATVVGNSLYMWEAGGRSVIRLLTDTGLVETHDLALGDRHRVVVTLKSTVILVTQETMTVLVGMPNARCRFDSGILYLLDGHSGLIWDLKGLDQMGTKKSDRDHAQQLINSAPKNGGYTSSQFMEASRIIGCAAAQELLLNASR